MQNSPEDAEKAIERIAAALDDKRLTINALDDGSGVVLDVDGERMLTANATGIRIVQAIANGASQPHAIAARLSEAFEVDEDRARDDVCSFVTTVATGL